MTVLTADTGFAPTPGRLNLTAASILKWLANNSRGAAALAQHRRLSALSDAELSRRGLNRADITYHVFAPHYYR